MKKNGHVAHIGEIRHAHVVWVGMCEGKRPQGRHRCRWKDNNKVNFNGIAYKNKDWINLVRMGNSFRFLRMISKLWIL
jgi:hypothetical protein